MASTVITSFFTKSGVPRTGLKPTIRIWEVGATSETLIIGTPNGTGDPGTGVGTDGIMQEVYDTIGSPGSGSPLPNSSRDGFYKFEFTDSMGYDITKRYLVRVNGGQNIPPGERYQTTSISPVANLIQIDISNILDVVTEIRKYHKNRTLIDENNFTLTVFDDGSPQTPLKVFDLKDENGVASITSIFERIPQ